MRIGVDLGGTKIEVIALAADGAVAVRRRTPTPHGDYEGVIRTILELVRSVETECGLPPTRIGLGTPGSISPVSGLLRNSNSTFLNGRPFAADLSAALGDRGLRMENDANCFAMSEASDGAAAGAEIVFGVILGTGVGGGVVVHAQVLGGANGVAGEWGHTVLPSADEEERAIEPCWCGQQGCLETFLSGPALARDYARIGGSENVDGREIAGRAEEGEPIAARALARFDDRLGRALAGIVNVLDPNVVVLGGGLSNLPGLPERAAAAMRPHVFSDHVATKIVVNKHGDSSGVRGAAWLWPQED